MTTRTPKAPTPAQIERALTTISRLGRTHRVKSSFDLHELAKKINPWIASHQMEWCVVEEQHWHSGDEDSLTTLWRGFTMCRDWEARETWAFFKARSDVETHQLFSVQIHLLFSFQPVDGDSRTLFLDPATGLRWVWRGRDKWRSIHSAEAIAEWEARDRALDALIGAAVRGAGEDVLAPLRAVLAPKTERQVAA